MFCNRCGQQIPDGSRFCNVCGADLGGGGKTGGNSGGVNAKTLIIVGAAVVLVIVLVLVLALGAMKTILGAQKESAVVATAPVMPVIPTEPKPEPTVPPTTQAPEDGWVEKNGETYYYENGMPIIGWWEIDQDDYYFDESGRLMKNTTVEVDGNTLTMNGQGVVVEVCYGLVETEWANDKFNYGNGGRCSYLETVETVKNCTSFEIYIQAEGLYGSSVNGNWKAHIRTNGVWKQVATFSYSGSFDSTKIRFDFPTDFDAVAIHPTVQGNASYQCGYALVNAACSQ